tara:strand:- start:440 stop:571 length:132 start_codon:yes stop_codon:yes gene_type:complete
MIFGISVIMLNLGMYLGVPAVVIVGIRETHGLTKKVNQDQLTL